MELNEVMFSNTAQRRMAQQGIRREAIKLALGCGQPIYRNGTILYFLGRRDLPDELTPTESSRFEGTAVVAARDGKIITVSRRGSVPRKLRRRVPRRNRNQKMEVTQMIEINHHCQPCHPFIMEQCVACIQSKFDVLTHARQSSKRGADVYDMEKRDDLFSLMPESQVIENEG